MRKILPFGISILFLNFHALTVKGIWIKCDEKATSYMPLLSLDIHKKGKVFDLKK